MQLINSLSGFSVFFSICLLVETINNKRKLIVQRVQLLSEKYFFSY